MSNSKFTKKALVPVFAGLLTGAFAMQSSASVIDGSSLIDNSNADAYITAGNGDNSLSREDALAGRTDANVSTSRFTGVVSIQITKGGSNFICTGTAISQRHILTAAHCVDSNGQGQVVDVTDPNNQILTVFNHDGDYSDVIAAQSAVIHEDYQGFNVCPDGTSGCVNDDVAVIELDRNIPAGVEIYEMYQGNVRDTYSASFGSGGDGDIFAMVGYGTRGDGYSGFYRNDGDFANGSPRFNQKLVGANIVDFFAFDDEGINGPEVWYADFDGTRDDGQTSTDIDFLCDNVNPRMCSSVIGDDLESGIGGGDSGGPSFIYDAANDKFLLAGINTFGINTSPIAEGAFGHIFGGIVLSSYQGWISAQVPTPATLGLFALAFAGLATSRRKSVK